MNRYASDGASSDPVQELVQQTRLSCARVGNDGDEPRAVTIDDCVERVPQYAQFLVPSDSAGLHSLDAPRRHSKGAWLGSLDLVHAHVVALAAHLDLAQRMDVEHTTHGPIGVVGDEHAVGGSEVLDPARDVDRVTHHRVLGRGSHRGEVCGTRADPNAHRNLKAGLPAERRQLVLESESRPHGPFRIVLPCGLGPPHRHHRITDVLVDPASMLGDDYIQPCPNVVHPPGYQLGIHVF